MRQKLQVDDILNVRKAKQQKIKREQPPSSTAIDYILDEIQRK